MYGGAASVLAVPSSETYRTFNVVRMLYEIGDGAEDTILREPCPRPEHGVI